MCAQLARDQPAAREGYIPVEHAALWYRDIGQGPPIIVLHGGPEFDYNYLLPELDRLSDAYRLIYYDQRGRGRSAANVEPEDVGIQSDVDDVDRVRSYLGLESVAVLGHSWGGLLAMEYALRYPDRVSHLILLNTAFVTHDDLHLFQRERRRNAPADMEQLQALSSTPSFQDGDPETVATYLRIHFRQTVRQPEQLESLVQRLSAGLKHESILKSRRIEARLVHDTWLSDSYDLLPNLKGLDIPTLVIHGAHDFIPVDCAARIAEAIPGARFVLLADCGHFSYLECPDDVRNSIDDLFQLAPQPASG